MLLLIMRIALSDRTTLSLPFHYQSIVPQHMTQRVLAQVYRHVTFQCGLFPGNSLSHGGCPVCVDCAFSTHCVDSYEDVGRFFVSYQVSSVSSLCCGYHRALVIVNTHELVSPVK